MITMAEMRKKQVNRLQQENGRIRDETIEECARVAESYGYISEKDLSKIIATAIRALKDKP